MPVIKNCLICKKEMHLKPSHAVRIKYCSRVCMHFERAKITKKCLTCQKEYKVARKRNKTANYCSIPCRHTGRSVDKKCLTCQKEFKVRFSVLSKTKFCSKDCQENHNASLYKKANCQRCESVFSFLPSQRVQPRFCSTECMTFGGLANCQRCGKEHHRPPSQLKGKSIFCSKECLHYEFYQAKPILDSDPSLKWCVIGKHIVGATNRGQICKKCAVVLSQNRRQLITNNGGNFTPKQWTEKLKYFGNRCYLCKKSLSENEAQIEHRIPLSRGGTNWIANIAPACSKCNYRKHNKTEKEFKIYMEKKRL